MALAPLRATDPRALTAQRDRTSAREYFVLDLFRHIAAFRTSYDPELLERAASYASRQLGASLGDEAMAAAIRLDNEIRAQSAADYATPHPFADRIDPVEDDFLDLLRAVASGSERAAIGAASRLSIVETRTLFATAREFLSLVGWRATRPAVTTPSVGLAAISRVAPGLSYGRI